MRVRKMTVEQGRRESLVSDPLYGVPQYPLHGVSSYPLYGVQTDPLTRGISDPHDYPFER